VCEGLKWHGGILPQLLYIDYISMIRGFKYE
jgi:hypothetical protein